MILVLLSTAAIAYATEPKGSIDVTISNIRNNKGNILISLFNQENGFPADSTKVFKAYILDAQSNSLNLLIDELPPGEYAIAIVHDENENLALDTNLLGAPVEGYAASGKNKKFSSPRFESSKFRVKHDTVNLIIKLNYLF